MSRLEGLVGDAILHCQEINGRMSTLKELLGRATTAANSLGKTVDEEVGALRTQLQSLRRTVEGAEATLAQSGKAATSSLETVPAAAQQVAAGLTAMTDGVTHGAGVLQDAAASATAADVQPGLAGLNENGETLHGAMELLRETVDDARGDAPTGLVLDTVTEAVEVLHDGVEVWASAQDELYETILAQVRGVAAALATSADQQAYAVLAAVNGMIDACNEAAQSVYGSLINAPPRLTEAAHAGLGEALEEMATWAAQRLEDLADLDRRAAEAESALESDFSSIEAALAATKGINP